MPYSPIFMLFRLGMDRLTLVSFAFRVAPSEMRRAACGYDGGWRTAPITALVMVGTVILAHAVDDRALVHELLDRGSAVTPPTTSANVAD